MEILRTVLEDDRAFLLRRRARGGGDALEIVLGNVVLLSSAALETEVAFGNLARGKKSVIVGGLGFGATLRGVLEVVSSDAEITVVEKLGVVIDVANKEAKPLFAGALEDRRVKLVHGDVADVIATSTEIGAILLDVDNGPEWASFRANARLYADAQLKATRGALAADGIFAVWSGYAADAFVPRLRKAGFLPKIVALEERGTIRARAYVGVRPA